MVATVRKTSWFFVHVGNRCIMKFCKFSAFCICRLSPVWVGTCSTISRCDHLEIWRQSRRTGRTTGRTGRTGQSATSVAAYRAACVHVIWPLTYTIRTSRTCTRIRWSPSWSILKAQIIISTQPPFVCFVCFDRTWNRWSPINKRTKQEPKQGKGLFLIT